MYTGSRLMGYSPAGKVLRCDKNVNTRKRSAVTLVKNMCFDLLRSGKYVLSRQTVELTAVQDISQADNLEVRDEVRQVKDIIAHLPEQQQRIVNLRDVKGCSYEEIEQVTGLNSTNIRVLLSRARKRIREEFNKWNNYESRGN